MKNIKKTSLKIMAATISTVALFSSPSMAIEKGDFLINTRILNVAPDVGSNQIMASGLPLAAPAGIDIDDAASLGVDITYMMSDNFGLELMLDTSSNHDIQGTGNLAGVTIADVNVLPPSLIALWHFSPDKKVRPYVGAGLNYTGFFNEGTTDEFTTTMNSVLGGGVTSTGVSVDNSFGIVAQAGVDIDVSKNWYLSLDAKYIDLDTTAIIDVNGVNTASVDFDVDPLVLGVGLGTRF